jgi:predicted nucleic acid-binding protein
VDKPAVINASPLIFLSRGQQMELLRHFAGRILVPEPVANEILMKGPEDITTKALDSTSWLEVVPVVPVPEKILEWGLGPGESSVLAFANEHPGMEAIITDSRHLGHRISFKKTWHNSQGPACHGNTYPFRTVSFTART